VSAAHDPGVSAPGCACASSVASDVGLMRTRLALIIIGLALVLPAAASASMAGEQHHG